MFYLAQEDTGLLLHVSTRCLSNCFTKVRWKQTRCGIWFSYSTERIDAELLGSNIQSCYSEYQQEILGSQSHKLMTIFRTEQSEVTRYVGWPRFNLAGAGTSYLPSVNDNVNNVTRFLNFVCIFLFCSECYSSLKYSSPSLFAGVMFLKTPTNSKTVDVWSLYLLEKIRLGEQKTHET